MTQTIRLTRGGEFSDPNREALYRDERLPESIRHFRLLFWYCLIANVLFLASDWRFLGQPHFPVAIAARTAIILASLGGMLAVNTVRTSRHVQILGLAWGLLVIAASAVLISPGSDLALFVTFLLPIVFYLTLPLAFAWTLVLGAGVSAACLASYLAAHPTATTSLGLLFGMVTINLALILVVNRSNRLQRLAWAATRAERAANAELDAHRRMLQTILKAVPAPLVILDRESGRLLQANDAARDYFGDQALGEPLAVRECFDRDIWRTLAGCLRPNGQSAEFETRLLLPDGSRPDVLLAATLAEVGGGEAILTVIVDITARKEMEAHLERLANTDPLTGLANRGRFFALATAEIRRTQRYGRPLSVIMLDIDFFKRINDTCGHEAGDLALRAFAGLCRALVRGQDLAGRLGGEEFALLLPETDHAGAVALAERLRREVEALRLDTLSIPMTVSVGVSEVLPGEATVDPALSRADQALYLAKRNGRNRTILYGAPNAAAPGA